VASTALSSAAQEAGVDPAASGQKIMVRTTRRAHKHFPVRRPGVSTVRPRQEEVRALGALNGQMEQLVRPLAAILTEHGSMCLEEELISR
jgi:hypothetical protein